MYSNDYLLSYSLKVKWSAQCTAGKSKIPECESYCDIFTAKRTHQKYKSITCHILLKTKKQESQSLSKEQCIHKHFMFCRIWHRYTLYCHWIFTMWHLFAYFTRSHCSVSLLGQRSLTYTVQVSLTYESFDRFFVC